MRDTQRTCFLLAVVILFASTYAMAHKPVVIDGGPTNSETAHEVPDPEVSYVGYHEATPGASELWFTFDVNSGTELYLQLGVPKIARFASLRPAMVLLGPGLPVVEVPFDLPEGYGGLLYATEGEQPTVFEEEFTGTTSWQFQPVRREVTQAGRYYLVGFVPGGEGGKFWMAIGEEESFGFGDILTLPKTLVQVRQFHEVFPVGGILGWALVIVLLVLVAIASLTLR